MTASKHLSRKTWLGSLFASLIATSAAADGLSTYGTPGMIDMPSAVASPDGTLTITSFKLGAETRNSLQFQITPRLAGVFRYSILRGYSSNVNAPDLYDRSFDLQYQLRAESQFGPALAIGLRDFGGTGVFGGEFLVASKHFGTKLTATGGIGWGRLGSYNGFSNPLSRLDDRFSTRPTISGIEETGRVAVDRFFRGDAAFFGGAEYQYNDRLRLIGEYSSDAYTPEVRRMGFERTTPINLGFSYRATDHTTVHGAVIGGTKIGFGLSYEIDPRKPPYPGGIERNMPPLLPRADVAALGWSIDAQDENRARLARGLADQGILLESYKQTGNSAQIVVENTRSGDAQALGRAARVMANNLPTDLTTFEITLAVSGMPTTRTTLRRSDMERLEHAWDGSWQSFVRADIADAPRRLPPDAGVFPRLDWSLLPYTELSLFDPDAPLRYDFGLGGTVKYTVTPGLSLNMVVRQKATGNLANSTRVSNSVLPHVRSDSTLYAKEDGPQVVQLTGDYLFRPSKNLYGRVSAGYFERMFAGVSTELLWYPTNSRLALGGEVNYVAQRDPQSPLGLTDYRVATGHASAYYDFGNTYYGQLDVGRYLAGDKGATLSLDRRFDNGFTVGAFMTITDVPFETFGEGSFDKGIRFTIPINWLTGEPSKADFGQTIRPILRDGGARLDVSNRLYQEVRSSNANELENNWGKFWR